METCLILPLSQSFIMLIIPYYRKHARMNEGDKLHNNIIFIWCYFAVFGVSL